MAIWTKNCKKNCKKTPEATTRRRKYNKFSWLFTLECLQFLVKFFWEKMSVTSTRTTPKNLRQFFIFVFLYKFYSEKLLQKMMIFLLKKKQLTRKSNKPKSLKNKFLLVRTFFCPTANYFSSKFELVILWFSWCCFLFYFKLFKWSFTWLFFLFAQTWCYDAEIYDFLKG